MKYIIKNILKEDYVNKKKNQEYLDFIVNEMLNGVTIKLDFPPNPTFSTLSEFSDLYAEEELDRIVSDPDLFNKLGWEESDEYDDIYYFRTNNPKDEYDHNEFYMEMGYDWIEHLEDIGELRKIENDEWELIHKDMVLNLSVNGVNIRTVQMYRVLSKSKYRNPVPLIYKSHSIIMYPIREMFKISEEEFGVVFTEFKNKLVSLLKDKWGVDVVDKSETLNESIVDDFIVFGKNELSMGDGFNVRLIDNNNELETLASYDMSKNEISVMSKNRAIPDVIRSIAHEMVHHKQNEMGDLKGNPEEGEDGSPWEDQANSKAGELVRKFGREFPEIYDL